MPRLTRIYTGKGDDGETALVGGRRVAKDSPRVAAYGSVDELNSHLGLAISLGVLPELESMLKTIQNTLFHLGADLATLEEDKKKISIPQIERRHVETLEQLIDRLNETVGPLENFVLPGGSPGAAALHIARTICRRAERDCVKLSRQERIGPLVVPYLNRLADALFVMARFENRGGGRSEVYWNSRA